MTKILVVDDDNAINELIKINLELQGYEIIQAYNGTEGFAKAKQEQPALIILDVMMPEVDGFYVLNIMKERDWMKDVPVVIISGDATVEVETKALKFGVNDFIHKPFNVNLVRQRIKNITELYNYRKQVEERFSTQTDILEKTNTLEGSFSFKAETAFIQTGKDSLYVGKDDSISKISLERK